MLILATNSKKASGNDYKETPPLREEEEANGQIRIKINKNKSILDHLAKFTRDLSNAIEGDDQEGGKGMTLLFYDFNGSKTSLSSRRNPNQTKQLKEVIINQTIPENEEKAPSKRKKYNGLDLQTEKLHRPQ